MQEKNQESGGGNMQRKLNWFDLICIGIGEPSEPLQYADAVLM
jgi:hypothetical protein